MRAEPSWDTYHGTWSEAYQGLNYDRSLAGLCLRKSHQLIERQFGPKRHFGRVLEVGAGGGQHLEFVRHGYDEYVTTDSSAEMLEVARERIRLSGARGVSLERQDATRLTFDDASFDRLVATHVLEHLYKPHEVLREWRRVLKPRGVMSLVLPSDPGMAWRLGRSFGPRMRAQAAGIDYDYWMAREHVNSLNNLVTFIRYYFDDLEEFWWPMRIPLMDINLFYACNIRV